MAAGSRAIFAFLFFLCGVHSTAARRHLEALTMGQTDECGSPSSSNPSLNIWMPLKVVAQDKSTDIPPKNKEVVPNRFREVASFSARHP